MCQTKEGTDQQLCMPCITVHRARIEKASCKGNNLEGTSVLSLIYILRHNSRYFTWFTSSLPRHVLLELRALASMRR